ncbi:MAG: NAD(+) synthase [Luteolibacter sp.]|uniref:NAD(+) synthase n=1 Tax=Luteolibacter sp. TaxID=1962973 RepID=UPI003264F92A
MKTISLAATALNQTPLAWRSNAANIRAAISDARAAGAVIVCLPELCIAGYGCEDAFLSPNTHAQAWIVLREILPDTSGLVVSLGLPVFHHNTVFNAAGLAVDGKLVALVCKRHLAGDGIHYEPRWFKPWPLQVRDVFHAPDNAEEIPIGDLVIDVGGVRLGFEICEDAWVARRPGGDLAAQAVDIILNPSASHFAFGKREIRRRFVIEGSRAFGVSYVYSNLLGNEAGRAIYDGQTLIAGAGELLAEGPRFSYRDHLVTIATVDLDLTRLAQSRTASHRIQLPDAHHPAVLRVDFNWPEATNSARPVTEAWGKSLTLKEEEFTRAVSLALFDYLRKSHTCGFTVSLSGGADSAAVVCLIHLMARLVLEDGEAVNKIHFITATKDARELTRQLLTTAYQATENSGEITREAAAVLAEAIGPQHHELDVTTLHQGYLDLIGKAIGREIDWQRDDIALQNIQARVRSPGIWMIANLTNTLLLSTSNRSEAGVGYATMDGDTSGSLAPIAGIDKAFLRKWLRWLETDGPLLENGHANIPVLSVINQQQPTAELRPAGAEQTDESDLMPYPVLDSIERAAIRDKRGPGDVLILLQHDFPEYPELQLFQWLTRFFQLWSRNQWKRERYAPSFHLDDQNLDPKTGCRWPILSGGFELELEQLEQHINGKN